MSEIKKEYENQAEQLKQIFNELQQHTIDSNDTSNELDENDHLIPKIDVLNLPPRKEVHSNQSTRTRLSISRPFLRFLSVIMLMIIIVVGAYLIWEEELIIIINHLK